MLERKEKRKNRYSIIKCLKRNDLLEDKNMLRQKLTVDYISNELLYNGK